MTEERMSGETLAGTEEWTERLELAIARIEQIAEETAGGTCFVLDTEGSEPRKLTGAPYAEWADYFKRVADFLLLVEEQRRFLAGEERETASLAQWSRRNHALYEDILPERYEASYANPAVAVRMLGDRHGRMGSFLYTELRSLIGFAHEGRTDELVIRLELFLEVYAAFRYELSESGELPAAETIREILYWFVSDYADEAAMTRVRELVCPDDCFAANLIETANLEDLRYLYAYGEYIGENELALARYMNELPEETIATMADTYTEGYRIGFEVTNKDLSKKSTVDIRYPIGMERMIRRAIGNFEKMGLKPVIYRAPSSILYNPSIYKVGFASLSPNRQYEFDHKDDRALFFDKLYANRKLEVMRTAFEHFKEEALGYAGPAVVESFGEPDFAPVNKPESYTLSEAQNALSVEHRSRMGAMQREYILEEERSFTIIAFPIPAVGEVFPELFAETIRINTLDYHKYQRIQEKLIEALNRAEYCEIKGMGKNRTDLVVQLYRLKNPAEETIFENCVADVNIPVGEVFTSPRLAGTNGTLHVTRVYLNGLEYRDLAITFEDGRIKEYSCKNFKTEGENQSFIKENILFRHETLPMGEFAIGTNTTAYVAARRLHVESKMPILIAEKTGPHFAVGDTCYSHAEEVRVYNPDGREIVAKDNEVSLLRKSDPSKAYFNCHTDITIPYDELGELTAVCADGTRIPLLANGRFVLLGTEELNEPLEAFENRA